MTENDEGEQHEEGPVHYQVSITGRQAGVFFIALLAALGLAFFFGMKTGAASRRSAEPSGRLPVADVVVPTPVPDVPHGSPSPAEAAEKPLGFEESRPGPAGAPSQAGSPSISSPAVKESGSKGAAAAPKGPEAAPPKSSEKPVKAEKAEPPAPKVVEHPAPKPETVEKPARPAASGKIWVQVSALPAEKADELVKKLKAKGYATDLSPVEKDPNIFRIRVGPYSDRAKAEAAAKKLAGEKLGLNPIVSKAKP